MRRKTSQAEAYKKYERLIVVTSHGFGPFTATAHSPIPDPFAEDYNEDCARTEEAEALCNAKHPQKRRH